MQIVVQEDTSVQPGLETSTLQSSPHCPDDAIFLGRWKLVDSETSATWLASCMAPTFESGQFVVSRQVNEVTGEVEYHHASSVKARFCCCCPMASSGTEIMRFTSNSTYMTECTEKSMGMTLKYSGNGMRVGNTLRTDYGGWKGTGETTFDGDKCRVTQEASGIGDESITITFYFERVERFV